MGSVRDNATLHFMEPLPSGVKHPAVTKAKAHRRAHSRRSRNKTAAESASPLTPLRALFDAVRLGRIDTG